MSILLLAFVVFASASPIPPQGLQRLPALGPSVLWDTTLATSTAPPRNIIQPSSYAVLYGPPEDPTQLYALTTSNGALNVLYSANGTTAWNFEDWDCGLNNTLCWNRQVAGDGVGLYVLQNRTIYAFDAYTGHKIYA